MRSTLLLSLGSSLLLPATLLSAAQPLPARRPNILLFLVDDMGWQDTSVPFGSDTTALNRRYHTPAMERLAHRGVRFTDAYAAPVSSPSRCSLLTGAHAARHRVTNWTLRYDTPSDHADSTLQAPEWNVNGLSPRPDTPHTYYARMLPELLRAAGYHTIHCGKAHFGAIGTPAADPLQLGFEVNIAGHAAGGPASFLGRARYGHDSLGKPVSPMAVPGLERYWDTDTYLSEALTLEAIQALRAQRSAGDRRPFFLYMSHYAVHVPFDRDQRFYQRYLDEGLDHKEAAYAALVEGMDKSLGDLMDELERAGQLDDTLILFMSDNGGLAASAYWHSGQLHWQNAPLYSGKGSVYEGGIRVPLIVAGPGVVGRDRRDSHPVMIEDLFPTLLEVAGARPERLPQQVDGRSLVPLLEAKRQPRERTLYWTYPHNWGLDGPGINFHAALRQGRWKLLYDYRTGRHQLYDLARDLGEQQDLSTTYPQRVRQLARQLGRYLRSVGAQRPSVKATGQPCPWPDEALR